MSSLCCGFKVHSEAIWFRWLSMLPWEIRKIYINFSKKSINFSHVLEHEVENDLAKMKPEYCWKRN